MTQLAYTNSVLSKPIAFATTTPWDMFLYAGTVPYEQQVYVYIQAGLVLIPLTTSQFDITVFPTSLEQFKLDILITPPSPIWTDVIIFRRVQGAYDPYQPGNPLTAESLNNRFNLLTLTTNDLEFYQKLTIPRYKANAIINHGMSSDPLDGMKVTDLELPFLGDGGSPGDVYCWAKKITNTPNPGDGFFESLKLESTADPDFPNFIANLAKECVPAPQLPGASLVGVCAPAPVSGGPGMTLHEYITVGLVSAPNAASSGAQCVGAFFGGAPSTVQSALTSLKTDTDANTTGVATNQANILINGSAISANTTAISTNTASITTNTTNIAANTLAIQNGVPLRSHFITYPVTVPSSTVLDFTTLPAPFNAATNIFKIVFSTLDSSGQLTFYYDFTLSTTAILNAIGPQQFELTQLAMGNNFVNIQALGTFGPTTLQIAFFARP